MNEHTWELAHELWAIAQSPAPVSEVIPLMVEAMERKKTGLRQLDSTLSLLDAQANFLDLDSRMDYPDLMEWRRMLLPREGSE